MFATEEKLWTTCDRYLEYIPLHENRDTAKRYLEERYANGTSRSTIGIDVNTLRSLGVFLGNKRFQDTEKADMVRYLNTVTGKRSWKNPTKKGEVLVHTKEVRLSQSTREKRKQVLKPFFRWLLGLDQGDTIPCMKGLRGKSKAENIPTDMLITIDELKALIFHAKHDQARAMIAVLYESGLRAGEFCALNIGSVVFDEYGAVLTLPKDAPGLKTGARRVRLFDSVSYLHKWFEQHPLKEDPKAPLWLIRGSKIKSNRLSCNTLYFWLKGAAKGAGIKKRIHPHLFRHTAATERARLGWNEGQMRAFFGWAKGSDMPSWYVHLAGKDYEDVEIERRGLKGRKQAGPALKPLVCRVCKASNPMGTVFCVQCRNPVSPDAEAEVARQKKETLNDEAVRALLSMKREELVQLLRATLGEAPVPPALTTSGSPAQA